MSKKCAESDQGFMVKHRTGKVVVGDDNGVKERF